MYHTDPKSVKKRANKKIHQAKRALTLCISREAMLIFTTDRCVLSKKLFLRQGESQLERRAKSTFRENNSSIFWTIVKLTVSVDKVEMLCSCKHTLTQDFFTKTLSSTRTISLLTITVFKNCETYQMLWIQKKKWAALISVNRNTSKLIKTVKLNYKVIKLTLLATNAVMEKH